MQGDRVGDRVPKIDFDSMASLESWFGSFGFFDYYRKVVLENCKEIVRATSVMDGQKMTEARIDAMAHTHGIYLDFLAEGLRGRVAYKNEMNKVMSGGYGA